MRPRKTSLQRVLSKKVWRQLLKPLPAKAPNVRQLVLVHLLLNVNRVNRPKQVFVFLKTQPPCSHPIQKGIFTLVYHQSIFPRGREASMYQMQSTLASIQRPNRPKAITSPIATLFVNRKHRYRVILGSFTSATVLLVTCVTTDGGQLGKIHERDSLCTF